MRQTQSIDMGIEIPPTVFGQMVSINETFFLIGGSTSADTSAFEHYHAMDTVFSTNRLGSSSFHVFFPFIRFSSFHVFINF